METKQTLRYWLEQLEEPYKSQVLKNTDVNIDLLMESSLSNAIVLAFIWDDSPEGYNYWGSKYYKLKKKGL